LCPTVVVSSIQALANANPTLWATEDQVITLVFDSNIDLQSIPTVTIATNGAATLDTVNGGRTNWTFTYTMASGDTNAAIPYTISWTDANGNTTPAPTAVTSTIVYDNMFPVTAFDGTNPACTPDCGLTTILASGDRTNSQDIEFIYATTETNPDKTFCELVGVSEGTVNADTTECDGATAHSYTETWIPYVMSVPELDSRVCRSKFYSRTFT